MAKKGQKYPGKAGEKVPRGVSEILKKTLRQAGDSDENWDKKLRAMPPGKRKSNTTNKIYWETRANRSDLDPKKRL